MSRSAASWCCSYAIVPDPTQWEYGSVRTGLWRKPETRDAPLWKRSAVDVGRCAAIRDASRREVLGDALTVTACRGDVASVRRAASGLPVVALQIVGNYAEADLLRSAAWLEAESAPRLRSRSTRRSPCDAPTGSRASRAGAAALRSRHRHRADLPARQACRRMGHTPAPLCRRRRCRGEPGRACSARRLVRASRPRPRSCAMPSSRPPDLCGPLWGARSSSIPQLGSGIPAILQSLAPILTLAIAYALGMERPSARRIAGLGSGLAGAVIIPLARNAGALESDVLRSDGTWPRS